MSLNVAAQYGQLINNVDGNQHFHYVMQQREDFLRQVAATRTKARWFVWLGGLVLVGGAAAFARMVLLFLQAIYNTLIASEGGGYVEPDFRGVFDEKVFGLSVGLLGYVVAALGGLMMVIGIALHVTATARRRRVDRDLPLGPVSHGTRS